MKTFVSYTWLLFLLVFICLIVFPTDGFAFPSQMNYQGEIPGFTGLATTYFSIINVPDPGTPTVNYWTNDGSSPAAGNIPFHGVTTYVNNGKYSLDLGDTHYGYMTALWSSNFVYDQLYLRVWYRAGGPLTRIYPDKRLVCDGFAYNAMRLNGNLAGNASSNIPISNNTVNTNLNADKLDGQHGSFYQNAGNLTSGILPASRLVGAYTSATAEYANFAGSASSANDAITLSGYSSSNFLKNTGGTFTGTLTGGIFDGTHTGGSVYAKVNTGSPSLFAITGENIGLGAGIAAINTTYTDGLGLYGLGKNVGIFGYSLGTSSNAQGVEGTADGNGTGVSGWNAGNGYGVFGYSSNNVGVYGVGSSVGVYGSSNALNKSGIYGEGQNGYGVFGIGSSAGIYGFSNSGDGVYAISSGSYASGVSVTSLGDSGYGIYAVAKGSGSEGVYAFSGGAGGDGMYGYATGGNGWGVRGESEQSYGGRFYSGNPSSYAVYADGPSYFSGLATFAGGKSGYVVDICKNSGEGTLEPGDVVVIQGNAPPVVGEIPVILVAKAKTNYNTGVVGIVEQAITVEVKEPTAEEKAALSSGKIKPGNRIKYEKQISVYQKTGATANVGDYVNVVTLGAFKTIKVDASYGAVRPGDLLTTSANSGYAMKARPELAYRKPGCIIGKALGALNSGKGTIPVFIYHQ